MYSAQDLNAEIREKLDHVLQEGRPVAADWLAAAVLGRGRRFRRA